MWSAVNEVINTLIDAWLWPLQGLSPFWQITALALPATLLSLLIFRFASNQAGITLQKDRIKAHLLELRLFRDDLGIMFMAQRRILRHTLRYMGHALLPMALMIVPFVLLLVQVETRFAYRGLIVGEQAILGINLDADQPVSEMETELSVPPELSVTTPALRIDSTGKLFWRVRAEQPGQSRIGIRINDWQLEKSIVVGAHITHLSPKIYRANDIRTVGYPAEPALEPGLPICAVTLDYPRARGEFAGLSSASWLLFALTLVMGFLLRGVVGVTF